MDDASPPAVNLGRLREALSRPATARLEAGLETLADAWVLPGAARHPPRGAARSAAYGSLAAALDPRLTYFEGGVYDDQGRVVPEAIHFNAGIQHLPVPDPGLPADAERLPGSWHWGGLLHHHFGHFLTESLGRLWAWPDAQPAPAGVLWFVRGPIPEQKVRAVEAMADQSFRAQMFGLLGIAARHRAIIKAPVRVERLVVPTQLLSNAGGRSIRGHPVLHRFTRRLAERAGPSPMPGAERLYVSRAGVARGGRFVLEEEIEAAFAAAGWAVMRPEAFTLAEQLAAYRDARELIFAEGSAIHLFALAARPEQRVGILARRLPVKTKFEAQLRGFGVRDVQTIDAVAGAILPLGPDGEAPRWGRDSDVALDGAALERALTSGGFVAPGAWSGPTSAHLAEAAEQRRAELSAGEAAHPHTILWRKP